MLITTKINASELYEFTIKHNYRTIAGILGVIFSLGSAVGGFIFWEKLTVPNRVLVILFALMFTVIEPIGCYIKVRKQIKKNFKYPISYNFSNDGIEISINEQKAVCNWYEVMKIESTANIITIYTSPIRAFIIPKKDVGENMEELKELIERNAECRKVVL